MLDSNLELAMQLIKQQRKVKGNFAVKKQRIQIIAAK